jgi:hypothetical protein
MYPLFSGPVIRRFRAEFHSILEELEADDLPWIENQTFELTDKGKTEAKQIRQQFESSFDHVLPETPRRLKKQMLDDISKDLAITLSMRSAASISSNYIPLVYSQAQVAAAPMFAALQVVIPNLSHLPWAEIVKIRESESLRHFREKLWLIETEVQMLLGEEDTDEHSYRMALAQRFIEELSAETRESFPKKQEAIGNVLLDLAFGLIPIPLISTAMTALREGPKFDKAQRSWVAAFLKLQGKR